MSEVPLVEGGSGGKFVWRAEASTGASPIDYIRTSLARSKIYLREIWGGGCEDRIGTGPPRARTEVIYVDFGYWAISGSIHPKGDPRSWGINSSVFRGAVTGASRGVRRGPSSPPLPPSTCSLDVRI